MLSLAQPQQTQSVLPSLTPAPLMPRLSTFYWGKYPAQHHGSKQLLTELWINHCLLEPPVTVFNTSLELQDLLRVTIFKEDNCWLLNIILTVSGLRKATVVKLNEIFFWKLFYCSAIQWKESSSTSPDPFKMTAAPTAVAGTGAPTACPNSFIYIPNLRSWNSVLLNI